MKTRSFCLVLGAALFAALSLAQTPNASAAQLRLNFTLPVASGTTSVEVTAAAESPLLTASSNVGGVIQGQQVLDLPLVDQNATNLAVTQAGRAAGIPDRVPDDRRVVHVDHHSAQPDDRDAQQADG